jgi:hypothetical protein
MGGLHNQPVWREMVNDGSGIAGAMTTVQDEDRSA